MAKNTLLSDKPEVLLGRFKAELLRRKLGVERMILFGSYARGKIRDGSDLDVCVVSKQFGKNYLYEGMKLAVIAGRIDPMIEPHPMTPEDLEDPYSSIAQEIREHGIVI